MPRFFLHLKQGAHLVRDHEGSLLRSADDARAEAAQAAREICAEAVRNGKDVAADAFIITDEDGEQVSFLPMADIIPQQLYPRDPREAGDGVAKDKKLLPASSDRPAMSSEMLRLQRIRAEIEQHTQSCRRLLDNIRRQLAAY